MTKLNLEFYKGADLYSDGDIEDEILEIVKNNNDFTDILQKKNNWAIMYHLSPVRRNLLQWYNFDKEKSLLEIGGGCGVFTGMFAQKLREVKVIELSRRRAEIIYKRHANYENLEIFVGNLNDIQFEQQFDYITLIGVLEYAGKFTDGNNPFKKFLENVKQLLKPDGKLIIAIENKFGLKYWAGAGEDHTGRNFDSIEDYPNYKGVQTFGKYELDKLVKSVGFNTTEFYYPMPDYKLPNIIYSDDYLPDEKAIFNAVSPNFDQPRYNLFNESLAYKNIIKNKMFDFFANSFLVFVS
jgi:SAM-dependent methyltransferase